MKKYLNILFIFVLLFIVSSCDPYIEQDTSNITMYIGLGNNKAYYTELKNTIKESLDIDVDFIYTNAVDTTNSVLNNFKNDDLPADIVFTAQSINAEYLKNTCLDLMSYTHVTEYFTTSKINEFINEDGSLYQLPFTSKLIGITYNETLLNEMGWSLPNNYSDMLELKRKCEENDILFSVSANIATGHGFNYLFHLMGAEWISSLEGTNWFNEFVNGNTDSTLLKQKSEYFNKWVENGLFGNIHYEDWYAYREFSQKRALFLFDLTNNVYSYEGLQYDLDGNPTEKMLNDTYKSIPWISEDGSNNTYAIYDNMFLAVNKKLANSDQSEKLEQIIKILDFLTTDEATNIFTKINLDGYVATKTFNIDSTRMYYKYANSIKSGYLMPWYYMYFDSSTIVNTGEEINQYLRQSEDSSFNKIFDALDLNMSNYINQSVEYLTSFKEDLSYENTAKLNCIGAIIALEEKLKAIDINYNVDAAIIAYVDDINDVVPFTSIGVTSTKVYKGNCTETNVQTMVSAKGQTVVAIKITGEKLKEIINHGLIDEDSTYKYKLYSKESITDEKEYIVAVSKASLNEEFINYFIENDCIILNQENEVTAQIVSGITEFLTGKKDVTSKDLIL